MNVSLYQAAAAMNASSLWQETIAGNLVASSLPGFKRQEVVFSAMPAGVYPTASSNSVLPSQRFSLPASESVTSFRQGEVRHTGGKTDLAIEGPGFFEVQMPNGVIGYTRDGEFRLNALGQLTNKAGFAVLSDAGPVQVDPNNPAPLTVAATGEISQGEEVRGRLRVTQFNQPSLLTTTGGGIYVNQNPRLVPTPATNSFVQQGMLEASNVSSPVEMSSIIRAIRAFEANQRIVQIQDDRMNKAIHDLSGTT